MHRRRFLQTAAALTVMSTVRASAKLAYQSRWRLSTTCYPEKMSIMERFQLAKDCGFERIECPTTRDQGDAETNQGRVREDRAADPFRHEHGPLGISRFPRPTRPWWKKAWTGRASPFETRICGELRRCFWCLPW